LKEILRNVRYEQYQIIFFPNAILLLCTQNTHFTKGISNKPISLEKAVTKLVKLIHFIVLGDSN